MSKRLEDIIRNNKAEFDDLEPSADLWSRIEKQLPAQLAGAPKKHQTKTFSLGFVLRVAAAVVLVMGLSCLIFLRSIEHAQGVNLAAINPEFAKQQVHYASLVETKRTELKEVAKNNPELYEEFTQEIANMDSTYKKLSNDLAASPNQELVLQAMIKNLQVQTEVLNRQLEVIEQYNKMQKDQKNEIKDI
jgi:hypothetical protein